MKKTRIISALLILVLCLALCSCGGKEVEEPKNTLEKETVTTENQIPAEGIWKDATYRTAKVLGQGKKEFDLKVVAEGKSLTFTVKTDEENLGKALLEAGIVEGEEGAYGLYIKKGDGMLADYDINQTYWSFCIDGEAQMSGVSSVTVSGGEEFELVLAK